MKVQEIPHNVWLKYKNDPDIETRNFILMNYIQLVKEAAVRLVPTFKNFYEYDDLYSSGIIGLMDAIERYDVNKNIKFET